MKIKCGVVGLGYWGPNYIRNLIRNNNIEVAWASDLDDNALEKIHRFYPQVNITNNLDELLQDKSLTFIAIATPPETHFQIAKLALEAGKHVFIAKPLASNSKELIELFNLAKRKKLILHCDLTYIYTGAIKYIKKIFEEGKIGTPLYYDSTRSNLGLIQKEVNVIWDLAPHDFAIIDYCFGFKPKKVFALASKHYSNSTKEEMAHIMVSYSHDFIAHIHLSWLSPVKIRNIVIGGNKKMIYFNDIEPDEKLKIYDKGIDIPLSSITSQKPVYRSGDVIIPKLDNEEALFIELNEFINQIVKKNYSGNNFKLNNTIITLLDACNQSIDLGRPINL